MCPSPCQRNLPNLPFPSQPLNPSFQPAPTKGFVRCNNKKDADYRYHEHPRTGYSIDTIRNLCVCPLEETVAFFEELVKEFGGAVKVKVLHSLPEGEREQEWQGMSKLRRSGPQAARRHQWESGPPQPPCSHSHAPSPRLRSHCDC